MTPIIWSNIRTTPNRWMAAYLRRQGWVVFYLEPQCRQCGPQDRGGCWLELYEQGERHERS